MLMRHALQRHPFSVRAFFRHTLVLTYAVPPESLSALVPPGLLPDTHRGFGLVAIAMVQTKALRPACLPPLLGRDFFLSGYRVFAQYRMSNGHTLRGLRILRSDTDSRLMRVMGNLLTHYNYQKARVTAREEPERLEIGVRTASGVADLHVVADLSVHPGTLPVNSPFKSPAEARRFAGPMPFTFDYEAETHSMIVIEGVREEWNPHWRGVKPILASAFYLSDVPYLWRRGVRYPLERSSA
jgi:hypothetical protein